MLQTKRVYEPASEDDGYRVLIDRLWPRGIKKSDLNLDEWLKDLAPSTELRRAFAHDPNRWEEFQKKYRAELRKKTAADLMDSLARRSLHDTVTLIYSAKDETHNNAVVLKACLEERVKKLRHS